MIQQLFTGIFSLLVINAVSVRNQQLHYVYALVYGTLHQISIYLVLSLLKFSAFRNEQTQNMKRND